MGAPPGGWLRRSGRTRSYYERPHPPRKWSRSSHPPFCKSRTPRLRASTPRLWRLRGRHLRAGWSVLPALAARRPAQRGRGQRGGGAVASPTLRAALDSDHLVRLNAVVREVHGSRERSVLAFEICCRHPTGVRAASSDVAGDAAVDGFLEQILERRPSDRYDGVGDHVFHDRSSV